MNPPFFIYQLLQRNFGYHLSFYPFSLIRTMYKAFIFYINKNRKNQNAPTFTFIFNLKEQEHSPKTTTSIKCLEYY